MVLTDVDIELSLIECQKVQWNDTDRDELEAIREIWSALLGGRYEDVLESEAGKEILGNSTGQANKPELGEFIQDRVQQYTDVEDTLKYTRELGVLCVGVSCLQLFIQNNWVGPYTENEPTNFLPNTYKEDKQVLSEYVKSSLSVDGEPVYHLTRHLLYLYLARTILLDCRQHLQLCQTSELWLLRCLHIHQYLLDERSPTLKATALELIDNISKKESVISNDKHRSASVQFHLEAGHMCYFYYEARQAKEHFNTARKLTGLDIQLTGVMGKRTKFQETNLAQLVMSVKRVETMQIPSSSFEKPPLEQLPKDLALDDDTVLNQIQLEDGAEELVCPMGPEEQAVVLGLCHDHRKSVEGQGKIVQEESLAYINCILSQPQNWSNSSAALQLRSFWECDSSRRVQRSIQQLEELVGQLQRTTPDIASRLHLSCCVRLPPRWEMEAQLASLLKQVGAVKAALEVYLRLHKWEEVIQSYILLGKREKAEGVIRDQLAIEETPSLWCYLGDVLQDPECYQKAWELSGQRSARAQKAWGFMLLRKKQFDECLEHFEKSLELNNLQLETWFSYGCAALAAQKYDKASKGFRNCVTLESDNFQGWNNLATALIRSNQKPKAFLALQEALKCDFENWRIWENLVLVGIDCGEFAEVIRGVHRLMELKHKDKWADSEVLAVLVRAINENITDARGNPSTPLRPKALELFGRITAKVTNNGEVWRLYAELLMASEEATQSDKERALQYLTKSHRCVTQSANWEKDLDKCKEVASKSVQTAKSYLSVSEKVENATQVVQMLSSARLMLKGVLSKIKQQHTDPVSKELSEDLREPCSELDTHLQSITDIINQRKGT